LSVAQERISALLNNMLSFLFRYNDWRCCRSLKTLCKKQVFIIKLFNINCDYFMLNTMRGAFWNLLLFRWKRNQGSTFQKQIRRFFAFVVLKIHWRLCHRQLLRRLKQLIRDVTC